MSPGLLSRPLAQTPGAIYRRKRRAEAEASGKCRICCIRDPRPNRKRCSVCTEISDSLYRVRTADYRKEDAAARKERRAKAAAAGMCKTCCIRERRHDSAYCIECGTKRTRFLECCASTTGHRDGCRDGEVRI